MTKLQKAFWYILWAVLYVFRGHFDAVPETDGYRVEIQYGPVITRSM